MSMLRQKTFFWSIASALLLIAGLLPLSAAPVPVATPVGELVVTPLFREGQPLVRYRLGDRVRLPAGGCVCGSELPTIEVLGRAESGLRLGTREVFPGELEEIIYGLPMKLGVRFWRARPAGRILEVEAECPDAHAGEVRRRLAEAFAQGLDIRAQVRAVPVGTFLPQDRLVEQPKFLKPRFVFGEGEDWNQGLIY